MEVIDNLEIAKDIFENGSRFGGGHVTKRMLGGYNYYKNIVIKDVDIQVPLIFGRGYYTETSINKIYPHNHETSYSKAHLIFDSGIFRKIHFSNFRLSDSKQENNTYPIIPDTTIEINGGNYLEPIYFSNSKLASVRITGGIFHSKVYFERGIYQRIEISGGEFKHGISFGESIVHDAHYEYTIHHQAENTPEWTSIYNGIYGIIEFKNDIPIKNITLSSCVIKDKLIVNSKETEISCNNLFVQNEMVVKEGIATIESSTINQLLISGQKATAKIVIGLHNINSNNLTFEGYCGRDTIITFKNYICRICKFENFINFGSISFNNFELKSRNLDLVKCEFSENAQRLNKHQYLRSLRSSVDSGMPPYESLLETYEALIKPSPDIIEEKISASIQFINSDIGKVAFYASYIEDSELVFKDSKLTDIFLAGTTLPNYITNFDSNDSEQKRLAISQIKKVYNNRGDNLTADEFKFRELEVLRKMLNSNKNLQNLSERWSLGLNYHSNRHGQDWLLSLRWLIIISLSLWFVICIILFDITIYPFNLNFSIFINSVFYFFQFLFPIHKLNLLEDFAIEVANVNTTIPINKTVISFLNFLDIIWRIIAGFLVYQLIAAFRRHGKS